ncbi:hypothetical protein Sthe_2479 [Sphaerobacter thermophilus DSM 20745]|mgnify:CR=1 FL=1|jgi:hypothetical protein|uniref:Uncharacterized protein n=1 Tax=Sphaerobacter thermophilus (strain ATCC 49802 / DSM 20745 / KCCM 41009 / NCIMB 13125 / S 6022) TaxID=479434 RepID=D1CAU7_SPHTD|nr:hypothetical protein Sthe_2479 [Sphaerobacter thermophilus DSM 20745]
MFHYLRTALHWRLVRAALFSLLAGASTVGFSAVPLSAVLAGLLVGLIAGSWWALALAPLGFVIGGQLAPMLGLPASTLELLDWVLVIALTLAGATGGVTIGRYLAGRPTPENSR